MLLGKLIIVMVNFNKQYSNLSTSFVIFTRSNTPVKSRFNVLVTGCHQIGSTIRFLGSCSRISEYFLWKIGALLWNLHKIPIKMSHFDVFIIWESIFGLHRFFESLNMNFGVFTTKNCQFILKFAKTTPKRSIFHVF